VDLLLITFVQPQFYYKYHG